MVYWIYKQNTDTGTKTLQEQLGAILALGPNPNPRGTRAATHLQTYRAVLASEQPHVHALWTQQHKVVCRVRGLQGGVWRGPQAGFRKDTLVQRQGSEKCSEAAAHAQGLHFPLTIALLLDNPMK